MKKQIILASTSPRRKKLFELLDIKFKVVDSGYEEIVDPKMPHEEMVKFLALGKAKAAAKKCPNAIIIAADTMVSFNGKIIGKPKDKKEAEQMLKSFSGKSHHVVTGLAILDSSTNRVVVKSHKIQTYFKKLSAEEIKKYIASGEPFDKAGAYGPLGEGINLIKKIEGDFTSCQGLPMSMVFNTLAEFGIEI